MTVNELIGKLNALPEEQKEMEVAFFDDYRDFHDIEGVKCFADRVWICEYLDDETSQATN